MFPLIYIIALEGLTALLQQDHQYTGILTPSQNRITHLGYADDTVIFINNMQDSERIYLATFYALLKTPQEIK